MYFLPTYKLSEKIDLSYTVGYNIFSSDNFKSNGGLVYGIGFSYKVNNMITVGINKLSNLVRLKYNHSHNDFYNSALGYIERTSEFKLRRTMLTISFNL